ncbi:hypothetical protein ACWDO0_16935 [Nocardia rhamnosiphila]|uniref:Uncharacterized protein n=2 Tax=Nocardia rhamnosiphila TaxID=426716 RepID=A0ABV2WS02_9NOCA|nr:hypothetical protein [Nocardia rhamnosiphila]
MDGTADQRLKSQIRAILDGRASARELMHSDAFNVVLDQTIPAAMQEFAEMPEEERQRLAEQGQAQLDRLRDQPSAWSAPAPPADPAPSAPPPRVTPQPPSPPVGAAPPGGRKSYRDQVVTPDEPDEDDLYFRDRWKNGWMQ